LIDNLRKPNSVHQASSDLPKKPSIITSQNNSVSLGFFDMVEYLKGGISTPSYHPPISKPSSAQSQHSNVVNPED
jgi:hypothetical protein